jgi:hypothetical protein
LDSPASERAVSLQIDTVNTLTGGFQQHLHLFREAVSFLLRSLALRNVFHQSHNVLWLAVCIPEQLKP